MAREQMLKKIEDLTADVLVETNEGTFSAEQCRAAVGCGDPSYGNYHVYESINGQRRIVGCDPQKAPGYPRRFSPLSAAARREQVASLRAALAAAQSEKQVREHRLASLARGWDGYQFVGVEEGQRIAASIRND